jgi:hypothetical protein
VSFLSRLFSSSDESNNSLARQETSILPAPDEDPYEKWSPDTFSLGWYYNKKQKKYRLAKLFQNDRATHQYVVGATGTGKTKFLENLIREDIERFNGFGIIDPHGDLIEDIKSFLAFRYCESDDPDCIASRVVIIDPTDPIYTVTFNPLEATPGVSVAEQVGELVSSFRKIWADSWGSRMEDLMRNSLIALGEAELTLCELTTFLARRNFRAVVLEKVTNPTALESFRRFDAQTDRMQLTMTEPILNKINAFLADDRMRQMFSFPKSSFSFREIMDESKILLIKLDKGKLKGCSDLLGSLLMAKIQIAAFSRSDISKDQRIPFYLYIDEFQNFATDSFKTVLSEARKYGLSLIMAHQTLSQIPDDLRSLVLSSAGIQIVFRVNRQDASLLAKELFQYSGFETKAISSTGAKKYWSYSEEWEHKTEDLQYLEPRQCFAKCKVSGEVIGLHTIEVEPSWELLGISESENQILLTKLPFGQIYLHSRKHLAEAVVERQMLIEKAAKEKTPPQDEKPATKPPEVIYEPSYEQVSDTDAQSEQQQQEEQEVLQPQSPQPVTQQLGQRKALPVPAGIQVPDIPPIVDVKVEREHRRLQHLIKKLAEQSGYKATIEQPTIDGQGRVDVGLESDSKRIACEVSVTTSPEHELQNIKKCVGSKYDVVILCSAKKSLHSPTCKRFSSLSQMPWSYILRKKQPRAPVRQAESKATRSS